MKIQSLSLAIILFIASAALASQPVIIRGEVSIIVEREAISVTVDEDHDGLHDHTFRLDTTSTGGLYDRSFGDAQVLFALDQLHVSSIDTAGRFTFSIAGSPLREDGRTLRIEGVGLSHAHHPGKGGDDTDLVDDPGSGGGNDGACSAGGPGAISCTIKDPFFGCTISCSTGYYACCTGLSCKCRKSA